MSLKAETFYALQCDFPECGVLWDGYEYTYFSDGPDTSEAEEDGWFTGDHGAAYCSAHTVEVECPSEQYVAGSDGEEDYCQWCEDHSTDQHLAPMPDSWANRLHVALNRITERAHQQLDSLQQSTCGKRGKLGELQRKTEIALIRIHEETCRSWVPGITSQEIFNLRTGRAQ